MMAAHESTAHSSRLYPKPAMTGAISMEEAATAHLRFIERITSQRQVPSARRRNLGADREKALHFYRSWYSIREERWGGQSLLYMRMSQRSEAYDRFGDTAPWSTKPPGCVASWLNNLHTGSQVGYARWAWTLCLCSVLS
jgi:hypothetical protein